MLKLCVFVLIALGLGTAQIEVPSGIIGEPLEQWIYDIQNTIIPLINTTLSTMDLSLDCMVDIQDGINFSQMWPLKMIDASAKAQTGLLTGNIMHVGNYDQCLEINEASVTGQYCTVQVMFQDAVKKQITSILHGQSEELPLLTNFIDGLKTSVGLCVPTSCEITDMRSIWSHVQQLGNLSTMFDLVFEENYCETSNGHPLDAKAIVAIVLFSTLTVVTLLSTCMDIYLNDQDGVLWYSSIYKIFSLYTNGRKMFKLTGKSDHASDMRCLNGLRVISTFWIIFTHRILISIYLPYINAADILTLKEKYLAMPVLATTLSVDTFFFISAMLLVYVYLSKFRGRHNLLTFYFHRFVRLWPSLAGVTLVFSTLLKYLGNGPFWPIVDELFQSPCQQSWWVTLLFLQNYIDQDEQCVGQAWYLAVDTQLYFASPVILFPLVQWPVLTTVFVVLLAAFSTAVNFYINFIWNFSASFMEQGADYHEEMYMPTHTRMTTWLMGFAFGSVLFMIRNKKNRVRKVHVIILWLLSILLMVVLVFVNYDLVNNPHNTYKASFYNSLSRPSWCLCLAWIIFACIHGYGGIINKFLSCQLFNFLIRINYSMYLLHLIIIYALILRARIPQYLDAFDICHKFYGDLFITVIVSIAWTLIIESPMIQLETVVLKCIQNRLPNSNLKDRRENEQRNTNIREDLYTMKPELN